MTRTSEEERARLAFQWAIDHGLSHRVECFDPPMRWVWNLSSGTPVRRLRIDWKRIPAWLGDRRREAAFMVRRWWIKRVLKLRNPYEVPAHD